MYDIIKLTFRRSTAKINGTLPESYSRCTLMANNIVSNKTNYFRAYPKA